MRVATRVRLTVSSVFFLLVLAALVGGFLVNSLVFHGHSTHAAASPSTVYTSVTKGVVAPAAVTKFSANPSLAAGSVHARGVRRLHTSSQAGVARVPGITSTPIVSTTPGLLQDFNGVSSLDSAKTNFGAEFEPPDQGLCAGNGFVIDAVNSAFTIYHNNGSVVEGPFNVNALYADGFKQFTSDPRCTYDKATHTWFAIILFINSTNTRARTEIAVNSSGDPTTPWTVYRLDATDDGTNGTPSHPGCPCLGDQPLLGIDQHNLYISTNEFSILGPQFNGAQIYALSKSQLIASSKVHFVQFDSLKIGGTLATSVQPATVTDTASAEYFMNSLDPNATFDNRLGVWALTNGQVVANGGIPLLSSVVITSEPYGVPPGAIQKGASSLIDSGDDRMQQVQYIQGSLWGALTTAVTIPNDTAERAGVAWFQVNPHLNSSGTLLSGATIADQNYVAARGNYLIYPAIQASPSGSAAMVMTLTGASYFPSAVYTVLQTGHTTFGAVHIAAPGTGPYDAAATRWGDYSYITLAPDGKSFWMATEYIPPVSSQTLDGARNWGTRVLQVSA